MTPTSFRRLRSRERALRLAASAQSRDGSQQCGSFLRRERRVPLPPRLARRPHPLRVPPPPTPTFPLSLRLRLRLRLLERGRFVIRFVIVDSSSAPRGLRTDDDARVRVPAEAVRVPRARRATPDDRRPPGVALVASPSPSVRTHSPSGRLARGGLNVTDPNASSSSESFPNPAASSFAVSLRTAARARSSLDASASVAPPRNFDDALLCSPSSMAAAHVCRSDCARSCSGNASGQRRENHGTGRTRRAPARGPSVRPGFAAPSRGRGEMTRTLTASPLNERRRERRQRLVNPPPWGPSRCTATRRTSSGPRAITEDARDRRRGDHVVGVRARNSAGTCARPPRRREAPPRGTSPVAPRSTARSGRAWARRRRR